MNLDDAQKQRVAAWIAEGLKLSEIQSRLMKELGVNCTYMEIRFLVDDLKLVPKDVDPPKPANSALKTTGDSKNAATSAPAEDETLEEEELPEAAEAAPAAGKVSVTVDKVTRPGSVVSGGVSFSDGNTAQWYLDQFGRLGMVPKKQGYKPAAADVQSFQLQLQRELQKMGF